METNGRWPALSRTNRVLRIARSRHPVTVALLCGVVVLVLSLILVHRQASAAPDGSTGVVIGEVQFGGSESDTDEFVELYNPTGQTVALHNWRLTSESGGVSTVLLVFGSEDQISSYGFLLVAHTDSTWANEADHTYGGASLEVGDNVLLYDSGNVAVDGLAWPEGTAGLLPVPEDGGSLERKAFWFSNAANMAEDGAHALYGNAYDSDRFDDFVVHGSATGPIPQNNESAPERCCVTVAGRLTLQGRNDHSGVDVLMWPGSGLRATTDATGDFSIPHVPLLAGEESVAYTMEAAFDGYLFPRATLDLTGYSSGLETVTLAELNLRAGDVNGDNRVNIFDLAIIGSHFGSMEGVKGDVNDDGRVNIQDLAVTAGNFGVSGEAYSWLP